MNRYLQYISNKRDELVQRHYDHIIKIRPALERFTDDYCLQINSKRGLAVGAVFGLMGSTLTALSSPLSLEQKLEFIATFTAGSSLALAVVCPSVAKLVDYLMPINRNDGDIDSSSGT